MSILRNILSRSCPAISTSTGYISRQASTRAAYPIGTLAKTHNIGYRTLTNNAHPTQPPVLSFEEFKEKYMETFETDLESLKKNFPEIPISKHEEIYKATCQSQYRSYVQRMTTDNDPARIL